MGNEPPDTHSISVRKQFAWARAAASPSLPSPDTWASRARLCGNGLSSQRLGYV